MAGHSHWAGIKHKKALIDSKRGKIWSKISKALMVAAKLGGPDPAMNPRLRVPLADARAARMPKENIERALKKGAGELPGGEVESILYEGYGPAGVAIMCDILTDNRNRTAPEIRKIFEKFGGKLGSTGCVAYLFERKGVFTFAADRVAEDTLMEIALETEAYDVQRRDDKWELYCDPERYADVSDALERAGVEPLTSEIARVPLNTVVLDADSGRRVLKLMEELDDHDDVQAVSANFELPEDVLQMVEQG